MSAKTVKSAVPAGDGGEPPEPTPPSGLRRVTVQAGLERYGLVAVFALLIVVFAIALPGQFFTTTNLKITLAGQAVILLLALAETIPLRAGDFDLSVAAVMVGSASLVGVLTTQDHWAVVPAVLVAIALAAVIGMINAAVVVGLGIDAFIATLGTMTWLGGVTVAFTSGNVISSLPSGLRTFANHQLLGLPLAVFYGWILVIVLWYVYEFTPFGRRLLFAGGNREAARLSGIRVWRLRSGAFVLSAMLSAFAGAILAGTVGAVDPNSASAYLLQPFAAAFLGTTVIQFGRFNAFGTLIGLYLLAAGVSGLQLLGVSSWVNDVFNGVTLVLAVVIATLMRRGALSGKLSIGGRRLARGGGGDDAPPDAVAGSG